MSFIFIEVPAESLRSNIQIITGDHSVLMSAGNTKLFGSSMASCRYASELTFKPIAVCFLRPQKNIIRFLEKNNYFTLSYFSPQFRHILDSFGASDAEKVEPAATPRGNIYYPQAEWVFECRKVSSLELILSREVQAIMSSEKKRSIYPGKETPRMFVGEIVTGWHRVWGDFTAEGANKLLSESSNRLLTSGEEK